MLADKKSPPLLPPEILHKIFQELEREDLIAVSQVCRFWREIIHSIAWQHLVHSVLVQQHNQDQLVAHGWVKEEHSSLEAGQRGTNVDTNTSFSSSCCSCLSLYLRLTPLRGGGTIKPRLVPTSDLETFHTTAALTSNSLVVASTDLGDRPGTEVRAYDRTSTNPELNPKILKSFETATDVHLYSHDNALVLLERSSQEENLLTSVISVHHFRLSLWNATNNSLVCPISFLPHIPPLPSTGVHTEVSDIALSRNTLAVHIFTTRLDWLEDNEVGEEAAKYENSTLLWHLDTSNVTEESVSFQCVVGKAVMKDSVSDSGFILLNERFLLRYLSGLFSYQSDPKFATRLQVFERNALEDQAFQPWVVEVNQIEVTDFSDCNDDSLKLEAGPSSRIAAFNAYNNTFRIIDLVTRSPLVSVDLKQEASVSPMFSCWQLYDGNWIGGNFVFLKEVPQLEGEDRMLRLVLVTDKENKVGSHVPGLPNFLLGQEISPLQSNAFLPPTTRAKVDLHGVALVSEELCLLASFPKPCQQ